MTFPPLETFGRRCHVIGSPLVTGVRVVVAPRATDFLVEHGLTVILRNYRRRSGELDIVAQDGDVLVVTSNASAMSPSFMPPKNRQSTTRARRGSIFASRSIASLSCSIASG